MYKGKMTYFYNGEKLIDTRTFRPLIYNKKERQRWKVIIVLPGVEIIPERTFNGCTNVETVIMADTIRRIEHFAFSRCMKLAFVRFSRDLIFIGVGAFCFCKLLTSIFIPESCREIGDFVFHKTNLMILVVPPLTELRRKVIEATPLLQKSIGEVNDDQVVAWVKSINDNDEYALHRLCSSMDPSEDEIYQMICEQGGPHAMARKNSIGITPSKYLAANPYADVDEMKLMKRFILENMGGIA